MFAAAGHANPKAVCTRTWSKGREFTMLGKGGNPEGEESMEKDAAVFFKKSYRLLEENKNLIGCKYEK